MAPLRTPALLLRRCNLRYISAVAWATLKTRRPSDRFVAVPAETHLELFYSVGTMAPAFDPDVTYENCDELRGAAQRIMESCACLVELAVDGDKNSAEQLASVQRSAQAEIKSIALATQVLVKMAQEWAQNVSEEQYLQVDFLVHCSKRLRKSILLFVGSTKECLSNTLDFLTREKQRTQSQNVVTHTQNVLGVVGILEQQATEFLENSDGIVKEGSLGSLLQSTNMLAASRMLDAALAGDSMALVSKLHAFANAVTLLEPKLQDARCVQTLKSLKDSIVAIAQDVNSRVMRFSEKLLDESVPSNYRETEFVSFQRMAENGRELLAEELISLVLKSQTSSKLPRLTATTNSGNISRVGTSERLKQVVTDIEKQRTDSPVVMRRSLAHGNALNPMRDSIASAVAKQATKQRSLLGGSSQSRPPPAALLRMAGDSSSLEKVVEVSPKMSQRKASLQPIGPEAAASKRKASLDQHKKRRKEAKSQEAKKKKLELKAKKHKHSRRHSAHGHEEESDTPKGRSRKTRNATPSHIPQRDHSSPGDPSALVSPRDAPEEPAPEVPRRVPSKTMSLSFDNLPSAQKSDTDGTDGEDVPDVTPRNASMAMEAAMAAAVPTFVEMFRHEFSWFEKYWKKEGLARQQEFTRNLKNQLVAVMPSIGAEYQPSQPISVLPLQGRGSTTNLTHLRGRSGAVAERSEEEAIQMMLSGGQKMKWMRRSSVTHNQLTSIVRLGASEINQLHSMADGLTGLEASIQGNAVKILNREDSNFAVEEQLLCQDGAKLLVLIQRILGAALSGVQQEAVEIERTQITEMATSISPLGTRDELFVAIANRCDSILQLREMVCSLKQSVYSVHMTALKSEATQLAATLKSVSTDAKSLASDVLLQVLACSRSLLNTLEQLVNQLATYRSTFTYVHRKASAPGQQRIFAQTQQASAEKEEVGEYLWSTTAVQGPLDLDAGLSLNEWLLAIVNPENIPTAEVQNLKKALCNTSPGTASCSFVIAKLREAFRPPSALRGSDVVSAASALLLKWVEYNYAHLNEHSLALLEELRGDSVLDDMFAAELESLLERKAQMATDQWVTKYTPLPSLPSDADAVTQAQLFLETPAVQIAEQLTLVDARLLRRIKGSELLAQAWSKDSLKPTAPNVVAILERLNHMSYWVPTVILLFDKLKIRGSATQKFYEIAVELRKLNNFNSLMSIIAGLNNAAASRLKFSLGVVHNALFEQFEQLEAIMSPQKNFGVYRTTISECAAPVLPYLGIYLMDLTYIDENPDKLGPKINVNKKLMISKILEEVKTYQKQAQRYENDIATNDRLANYLNELPYFGSDRLYKFSLQREPRQASFSDIL